MVRLRLLFFTICFLSSVFCGAKDLGGFVFKVDDVTPDTFRYVDRKYPYVLKRLFSREMVFRQNSAHAQLMKLAQADTSSSTADSSALADAKKADSVQTAPVQPLARKVVPIPHTHDVLFYPETQMNERLLGVCFNGFLQTVHTCFAHHKGLTLSPDEVWLAVCQGASIHFNLKMDSLKSSLYQAKYQKRQTITVQNDFLNDGYIYWEELVDSMAQATRQYTQKDLYAQMVQNFSTTTQLEKTAYQITLMDSHKKHFDYMAITMCGIPSVRLLGTPDDWKKILKALDGWDEYGLAFWTRHLKPVIREFVNASQGNPDISFWKNIYKTHVSYDGQLISGWIIKFFPYVIKQYDEGGYIPNSYLQGHDYWISSLNVSSFPSGISMAPMTWMNYGESEKVSLCSGFVGMRQHDDGSLEPAISWYVCRGNIVEPSDYGEKLPDEEEWYSDVLEYCEFPAIYDSAKFATPEISYSYLRGEVNFFMKKKLFMEPNVKDTLRILVLRDGTVSDAWLNGGNAKTNAAVDAFVKNMSGKWIPGKIESEQIKINWEYENYRREREGLPPLAEPENIPLISVSSIVVIPLKSGK